MPHTEQAASNKPKTHSVFEDFTSGAVAGVGIAYTTFPAEALKKRFQTGIEHHGFRYYRGSLLFATNIVPTTAIQLGTDKMLASYILHKDAGIAEQLAASAFCGVTGAITATPVENTVIRQQAMKTGAVGVMHDLYAQGVMRFWKTYHLIAIRDSIFTLFMLSFLPAINQFSKENIDERYHLAVNFAGSSVGAALSHPFDTVATNIQKTHEKISTQAMARHIYQTQGVRGFYNGLGCRLFLFFAFANGIPQFKQAADHYLFSRGELPSLFKSFKNAFGLAPSRFTEQNASAKSSYR